MSKILIISNSNELVRVPARRVVYISSDGNYCTMDIVTNDGAWYECYYAGGVLEEIWCFANEQLFMDGPRGWVADGVYIHPYTGKPFIPDYRDWDGDLHVRQRPQN